MAERGGQMPSNGTEQTGSGMDTATTGLAINVISAEAEGEVQSAGAQNSQPPPEGEGAGRDDGVARPAQGGQNQFTPGGRKTRKTGNVDTHGRSS